MTTREATLNEKGHYVSVVMKEAPTLFRIWLSVLAFMVGVGPFIVVYPYWDIMIAGGINMLMTMLFANLFIYKYGGLSRLAGLVHIQFVGVVIYILFRCFQDDIFGLSKVRGWQFWYLLCVYCPILMISWILDVIDVFRYVVLGDDKVVGIGNQKIAVDENDQIIESELQLTFY